MSGPDGLREAMAGALTDDVLVPVERGPVLDALLPAVTTWHEEVAERRARECAAGELTALAFGLLDLGLPDLVFEKVVAARDALAADDRTGQR